jgi:hypothetical protein
MLPPASDLFFHPIAFVQTCLEVLKLHTAAVTAETVERRQRVVDDVQKRAAYRKKHGMETGEFGGWTAKTDGESLGPAITTGGADGSPIAAAVEGGEVEQVQRPKKPLKKWLGIW